MLYVGNSFMKWLDDTAQLVRQGHLQREQGKVQMFFDLEKLYERYIEVKENKDEAGAVEHDV